MASRSNLPTVTATALIALSLTGGVSAASAATGERAAANVAAAYSAPAQSADSQVFPDCRNNSLAFARATSGSSYNATCYQITNRTQVFTAPNTLSTGTYQFKDSVVNVPQTQCVDLPVTSPAPGVLASFKETGWLQLICQAYRPEYRFVPPQPLPQLETANMVSQSSSGSSDWHYQAQCGYVSWWTETNTNNAVPYTSCEVGTISDPGKPDNQAADIQLTTQNSPKTIQIVNNLSNQSGDGSNESITLNGTPMLQHMILDLNGGYPQTIKSGEVGYFGLYGGKPPVAGMPNGSDPAAGEGSEQYLTGFSALYEVSPESTTIGNTSIVINVFLDPYNGTLHPSSSCVTQSDGNADQVYCSLTLEGTRNTAQKVIVNIHE